MNYQKLIETDYGYCNFSFEEDYVHIYDLLVFPKYRSQGKAKELLQITINEIRKTGYEGSIQIVAKPKDKSINVERLIKFYKSLGLEVFTCYK